MPNALVTSRDENGRRIVELVDVALNRAELAPDEARRIIQDDGGFLSDIVMVLRMRANSFVTALTDAELVERYPRYEGRVGKYRRFATDVFGVTNASPIVRRVYPGATLKVNVPKLGPCSNNFDYLQSWPFEDTPTPNAFVWGVPWIVPNSTSKSVKDQFAQLADFRREFELPAGHLANFGSVALDAAIICEEFKRTNTCVPLNNLAVRTDALHADGPRLNLLWDGFGFLHCNLWRVDRPNDRLGCLALGVDVLED